MKTSKIIELVVGTFIVIPIWFYLVYWMLSQLHPDRLVWFLFYVYVPAHILVSIISKVVEEKE